MTSLPAGEPIASRLLMIRYEARTLLDQLKRDNPDLLPPLMAVKFLENWSDFIEARGRELAGQLSESDFREIYRRYLKVGAEILDEESE